MLTYWMFDLDEIGIGVILVKVFAAQIKLS
jgi:hypothetical protein